MKQYIYSLILNSKSSDTLGSDASDTVSKIIKTDRREQEADFINSFNKSTQNSIKNNNSKKSIKGN